MNRRHPKRLRHVFTIDTADVRVFVGKQDVTDAFVFRESVEIMPRAALDTMVGLQVADETVPPQPPDDGRCREDAPNPAE